LVDYEPSVRTSDPELGTFQEFARQYLPLMVEHAFEIIIQKRSQSLEDELRNGLNVQDTIRTSLSELFKTWQEENLLVSTQNLIQGYRQPAATENDTINSEQAPPEFPDLDHSGSALCWKLRHTQYIVIELWLGAAVRVYCL
jgi:hypothetical protein